jgi:hypothetical protein
MITFPPRRVAKALRDIDDKGQLKITFCDGKVLCDAIKFYVDAYEAVRLINNGLLKGAKKKGEYYEIWKEIEMFLFSMRSDSNGLGRAKMNVCTTPDREVIILDVKREGIARSAINLPVRRLVEELAANGYPIHEWISQEEDCVF